MFVRIKFIILMNYCIYRSYLIWSNYTTIHVLRLMDIEWQRLVCFVISHFLMIFLSHGYNLTQFTQKVLTQLVSLVTHLVILTSLTSVKMKCQWTRKFSPTTMTVLLIQIESISLAIHSTVTFSTVKVIHRQVTSHSWIQPMNRFIINYAQRKDE